MKPEKNKELDKKIDKHYKEKDDILTIEMTPREIWEISKEFPRNDFYYTRFSELEQDLTKEIWYRGAKIVRKDK